jgi:hypothetical protein
MRQRGHGPMRVGENVVAIAALTIFICGNAASQTFERPLTLKPECVKSIQEAMQARNSQPR